MGGAVLVRVGCGVVSVSGAGGQAPTPDAATPVLAAQKPPRRAAAATRDVTANALSDSDVRSAPAVTEPSTRRTVIAAERRDRAASRRSDSAAEHPGRVRKANAAAG